MSSDTHDHDHGSHGMYDVDPTHYHPPQPDIEDSPLTRHHIMQIAVTELLIEKGIFTAEEMRRAIELMDSLSPARGAKLVARAWVDGGFKQRLLENSAEAASELGMDIGPIPILIMENTPEVHNVIVCTLCSCYPRMLLGLPPDWYKSRNYRSRVVREPRAVLAEFGTEIPHEVTIRVHDSNADMRYMVLPMRPSHTENMTEEQLAELVTRDCLIGVAVPRATVVDVCRQTP
jgi:nitrile hydratase